MANKIASDGSNMVYLYVDGVELGAMNNHFKGGTAQNTTSNWISGKDFVFSYIGGPDFPVGNCSIGYLQVEEGCTHSFGEWSANNATCTESGTQSRTCAMCGEVEIRTTAAAGHSYTAVTTAPTCTTEGYTTYTCTTCGDSYTADNTSATGHSFVNGFCSVCGAKNPEHVAATVPVLTLKYLTLAFEDEILYNAYFTVSDTSSVVEMGMITFASRMSDGTITDSVDVIPGYYSSGSNYIVHSNGVPAKNLGDALYFKVYAKLSDGTYAYSAVAGYNAVAYANSILNNAGSSAKAKSLVVAMLNYGAAAQIQFNYKTDSLMNAHLTAEQLALVDAVVKADASKVGVFVHNGGYTGLFPTVSFEVAFSINYYFTTKYTPDKTPTFYIWDAATYANASVLTPENAIGTMDMVPDGAQWTGPWLASPPRRLTRPTTQRHISHKR